MQILQIMYGLEIAMDFRQAIKGEHEMNCIKN